MRGAQASGEQIHSARIARGLTQEQLASLAGIDVKTLRKAERGQGIDLGILTRISFALDLDISKLIVVRRSPHELEIHRRDALLRWNRCFNAHDMGGLLCLYHDHAVLHLPGEPDIPFAGEHRGKEAIRRANEIAWKTFETEPMLNEDLSLLVSDNTVVLSGKCGVRLPDGCTEKRSFAQIFTFLPESELVVDHRVEYDTLYFARLLQLQKAAGVAPIETPPRSENSETSR